MVGKADNGGGGDAPGTGIAICADVIAGERAIKQAMERDLAVWRMRTLNGDYRRKTRDYIVSFLQDRSEGVPYGLVRSERADVLPSIDRVDFLRKILSRGHMADTERFRQEGRSVAFSMAGASITTIAVFGLVVSFGLALAFYPSVLSLIASATIVLFEWAA